MESGTEQTRIGESEGLKRKGEEERLFQLQRLKALFFSLAQDEEEKTEVDECFSSLQKGDQDAFYQKGCRLVQSFLKNKKLSKSDDREFLICFFIKGISSKLFEETNKAILSFLGNLLENDELKRKYSQEIVKRAMMTGYSFHGEDGEQFSCLKNFWQEIEYSEERKIPQINNEIPVCLICKRINSHSLLSKWVNELNAVFVKNEYSSSSPNRAEIISSFALRNKLFNRLQDNKNRNHSLTENNAKEERLKMIGMNKKQINDFFTKYNEITSLKVLYDSDVDEQTAKKCHEKLDEKGATITFIKKGNKFIGGIAYQKWKDEQKFIFDAFSNIFSISEEMETFSVQKKEMALFNDGSAGPKFGINDLTAQFKPLKVSLGCNLPSYSLPETFKKEFGMRRESSECDVERVVVFSFEYDTRKFLHRIIGNEEEMNIFVNLFKDVEEAKEFLECFENKEQAEEYLAKCSDGKEMSEHRMNFNESERRKLGGECGEDCFWILKDGTLFIEGNGKMKDYERNPEERRSTTPWYSKSEQIKDIVISEGITTIGNFAFSGCSSLTSITIPDSVTTFGERAFWGCSSLTSITILNSVTKIGNGAFFYCFSLTSITIPNSITSIGRETFENCFSLTSIIIPTSVKFIGADAFEKCTQLTSGKLGDISWKPNEDKTELLFTGTGRMPEFLKGGAPWSSSCSQVRRIKLSEGITSIGDFAFSNCEKLEKVFLPSTIESIGFNASIKGTEIPPNVKRSFPCGENCFATFSNGVFAIEGSGKMVKFKYFKFIPWCSIRESIKEVKISEGITSIGGCEFSCCSSLTTISVSENNEHFVSVDDILFTRDMKTLLCYPAGKKGSNFSVPNSVTTIGEWAFSFCSSLKSITIPNSVIMILKYAFRECSSLTSITIPDSVTMIEEYAFYDCSSLTSITISNNVTIIGYCAFSSCSSLTTATLPRRFESQKSIIFYKCDKLKTINWTE